MTLILNGNPPMHWALAGAVIAAITLTLLFVANKRLGLSTGLEDLCSLASSHPYFRQTSIVSGRGWRLPFLGGLVLGGFASATLGGGWTPTWALGMLDQTIALGSLGKLIWMFVGGIFIGFGTRLGGGCTSGHGIFGVSNFERPSLVTMLSFMAGGIVTTQILYRLVLR